MLAGVVGRMWQDARTDQIVAVQRQPHDIAAEAVHPLPLLCARVRAMQPVPGREGGERGECLNFVCEGTGVGLVCTFSHCSAHGSVPSSQCLGGSEGQGSCVLGAGVFHFVC